MKALKFLAYLIGAVIIIIAGIAIYLKTALPDTGPAANIKIDVTPERVERGRYLANHVTLCVDCHSTRDWTKYAAPMIPNTFGVGGEVFDQSVGFPGSFYAPNITPYKLGNWTDGEILRAVTTGVNKQGKALFPVMGYHRFGKMDEEDVKSIIAYIRTLPPVKSDVPASKPDFVFSFILNTLPEKASFSKRPPASDNIAYGRYVVNAAGCVECHSRREKGELVPGSEFGGGMEFAQPAGIIRSVNITMDKATGIGTWDRETFIQRFKAYADSNYVSRTVAADELNTPMPWTMFAHMTTQDLNAIYDYLQTVKPIVHKVEKFAKKQ